MPPPPIFFLLRDSFFFCYLVEGEHKENWGESGGKECLRSGSNQSSNVAS